MFLLPKLFASSLLKKTNLALNLQYEFIFILAKYQGRGHKKEDDF